MATVIPMTHFVVARGGPPVGKNSPTGGHHKMYRY